MKPIRILIVDDNQIVRTAVAEFLSSVSEVVVVGVFDTPQAVLAALEALRADLLLTDVEMPGMDGFSLARQVRAGADPPRVVIMSASQSPDYDELALRVGADAFIYKPTLHAALPSYLSRQFGLPARGVSRSSEHRNAAAGSQ